MTGVYHLPPVGADGAPADLVAYPDDPRGDPEILARPSVRIPDGRPLAPSGPPFARPNGVGSRTRSIATARARPVGGRSRRHGPGTDP